MIALRPLVGLALAVISAAPLSLDDASLRSSYPDGGPGAFAIAAAGSDIVFSRGYGLANVELRAPFRPDSVVRIASLTKQFTAIAILKLVEERKLSLDEPLREAWHQCPPAWAQITLRHLLSHLSGITDDLAPLFAHLKDDLTVDQLLNAYAGRPLLSPTGSSWRYSNVNYWILGKVIEIQSGETYADFVAHHVLVPGMLRTRYGSHDAIIEGRAAGYEIGDDGAAHNARFFSATLGYAAGGFLSTPADMAIWYAALARGEIVSRASLALASTETKTRDGKPTGYGLGWYVGTIDGVAVVHHGGSTFGFESYVYWAPERGIFVGVFKNRSDRDGEPQTTARGLFKQLIAH